MSFYTGTQAEVLYSGPPANFPAAGASSTSAVNTMVGATGDYSQPLIPGGFWQQGRTNQLVTVEFYGACSGQGSATTATFVLGLDTAANTIGGSTLLTYPALTITSYSSGTIAGYAVIQNRGAGYGTSSVATNLLSSGTLVGYGNSLSSVYAAGPTALQTTDFSVNQWLYLTVQMSTSSASNTFTLEQVIVRGEN
jgi:hypothetical protein